jgi:6-phosphogluconolactonase
MTVSVRIVLGGLLLCGACSGSDSSRIDGSIDGVDGAVNDSLSVDAAPPAPLVVLVGTSNGTVHAYSVNDTTGALTEKMKSMPGGNRSFLAMDLVKRIVYAVDEAGATVRAYTFDPTTYALTALGAAQSTDAGVTHVSLDPARKLVLVANYSGDTAATYPINSDGSVGTKVATLTSGDKSHQAIANPSGGWMFVPALGTNMIMQYSLAATGIATANGSASPPAGAGPRHLAFRPDEAFAYGINELASSMTAYSFNKSTGKLTAGATTDLLAPGAPASTGAEVAVHPNGTWVYGSVRGSNRIVTLSSNQATGELTLVERTPAMTTMPRSFGLDPDGKWMFVGSQNGNLLATFSIGADGAPDIIGTPLDVGETTMFVGAFRVQ